MSNNEDIAIKVSNVSKTFKLPHEKHSSVKGALVGLFNSNRSYEKQRVLKDVSFEIKKGEFFGIVGRNGSGKSTLLKLLAGIYSPDKGDIQINGKLTPFIELGVGFNPELTGRENVFLNGALLGFSRKEMTEMYDEIVEFAELEKFMDQKLKNYSSGMQVRLAFSIAIRANTEILVLDEVLAVGDYNFQQKCFRYFRELKRQNKTVILVSHDSGILQMFCKTGALISNGELKQVGDINEILKAYAVENQNRQEKVTASGRNTGSTVKIESGNNSVEFLQLNTFKNGRKTKIFRPGEEIEVCLKVKFLQNVTAPVFGLVIQSMNYGIPVIATNTLDLGIKTGNFKSGEEKTVKFLIGNILDDSLYYISGAVASSDRSELYVRFLNAANFSTAGWIKTAKSLVYPDITIDIS